MDEHTAEFFWLGMLLTAFGAYVCLIWLFELVKAYLHEDDF
jgi:hypothetical protein